MYQIHARRQFGVVLVLAALSAAVMARATQTTVFQDNFSRPNTPVYITEPNSLGTADGTGAWSSLSPYSGNWTINNGYVILDAHVEGQQVLGGQYAGSYKLASAAPAIWAVSANVRSPQSPNRNSFDLLGNWDPAYAPGDGATGLALVIKNETDSVTYTATFQEFTGGATPITLAGPTVLPMWVETTWQTGFTIERNGNLARAFCAGLGYDSGWVPVTIPDVNYAGFYSGWTNGGTPDAPSPYNYALTDFTITTTIPEPGAAGLLLLGGLLLWRRRAVKKLAA